MLQFGMHYNSTLFGQLRMHSFLHGKEDIWHTMGHLFPLFAFLIHRATRLSSKTVIEFVYLYKNKVGARAVLEIDALTHTMPTQCELQP